MNNKNVTTDKSIAQELADFAVSLHHEDIPAAMRERASYLILDAVGIALASTQYDFAHRMLSSVSEFGPGESDVIGFKAKLPMRDAVMMNGFLVHGLDFDDTHTAGIVHATSSAFPTAMGLAAHQNTSGREMLSAYITGVEVSTRLGMAAKGKFHKSGFHPTGLVGAFGCVMTAGRLRNMTSSQLAMAQGIVLSMASGSLEFLEDGAWNKRVHPGWAGFVAITAAAMAKNGFIGASAAYEGRFGLYANYLDNEDFNTEDFALITAGLGEVWEVGNIAVKPMPACHFTHACIDAAIAIHDEHGLQLDEIESVRALIPEGVIGTVCEPEDKKKIPQNSYEAQFSIPYAVATGLLRGQFGLNSLEADAFKAPDVLALAARVDYEIDPDAPFPKYYSGEVIVRTKDGRELGHREEINRGASDRPLSNTDISKKFHENAATALAPGKAREIEDIVLSLDQLDDARTLSRCLSAQS